MKQLRIAIAIVWLACSLGFVGCSESKKPEPELSKQPEQEVKIDPAAEEAAKALRKELRAPIEKARDTQQLGDERTEAIDRAVQDK